MNLLIVKNGEKINGVQMKKCNDCNTAYFVRFNTYWPSYYT